MPSASTVLIFLTIAAAIALWKTGKAERFFVFIGLKAANGASWLSSPEGAWVNLPDALPYRDFVEGRSVVETEDGWLWAGLHVVPVATDGFSGSDWNRNYAQLNRVITGLPDNTCVQVINSVSNDVRGTTGVYDRLIEHAPTSILRTILRARKAHLAEDAACGLVSASRTYVFIGRQRQSVAQKIPLRTLWSSEPLVKLEQDQFEQLQAETLNARDAFASAFQSSGGRAYPLTAEQIFALVYERLNPERAENQPPPVFQVQSPRGNLAYSRPVAKLQEVTVPPPPAINEPENESGTEFDQLLGDLLEDGAIDTAPPVQPNRPTWTVASPLVKDETRVMFIGGAGLFADSPRERLCFEPITVMPDHFIIGKKLVMVVSLQQLPTLVFSGLCESLTRHPKMNFPFEVVSSFQVGDRHAWDDKLAKKADRMNINLQRSNRPDQAEQISVEEIQQLRADVRRGEAKLGEAGMSVVFTAKDLPELQRRRDIVFLALRSMEGLEGVVEKHCPFPQFTATLPCATQADARRRACLSRDAVGLMPLTGGNLGPVREAEATMVFERVDGGLLYWDPHTPQFPSGMQLICGGSGSGKSGLLNFTRTALAAAGYRLLTIDFGGSSSRVCEALGGSFLDITDARQSYKLGLFDIRPRKGEQYKPDELTDEGLPRDRLAEVENLLEQLCLDPRSQTATGLPPRLAGHLRKIVRETYSNLVGDTPRLDDFLNTLKLARNEDRELAQELEARLEIYASEGSLGRFLNEDPGAQAIPVECPYIVFDLRHAKEDPRLMLVAALAVNSFIRRLLADTSIPKYLDVDEFNVVAKNPLLCNIINETMRTARKMNGLGCVASQSPGDFAKNPNNPAAAGIRDNTEIFWLMRTSNPDYTAEVFQLKPGTAKLVRQLQTQTSDAWRDAVLLWPGNGCAHLRLRFGTLDKRLLLGAGHQLATLQEALTVASHCSDDGKVTPQLRAALAGDPLGTQGARDTNQPGSARKIA